MEVASSSPISRVLAVAGRTLYCSKDEISTHVNIVEGIEEGSNDLLGFNEDSKDACNEGSKEGELVRDGFIDGDADGFKDIVGMWLGFEETEDGVMLVHSAGM